MTGSDHPATFLPSDSSENPYAERLRQSGNMTAPPTGLFVRSEKETEACTSPPTAVVLSSITQVEELPCEPAPRRQPNTTVILEPEFQPAPLPCESAPLRQPNTTVILEPEFQPAPLPCEPAPLRQPNTTVILEPEILPGSCSCEPWPERPANTTVILGPEEAGDIKQPTCKSEGQTSQAQELYVGCLLTISGPWKGYPFMLRAGANTIGRTEDNDLVLEYDPYVSRSAHAIITYNQDYNIFILSAGKSSCRNISLNGSYLGDMPEIHKIIQHGDIIELSDDSRFRFIPFCDYKFTWN